MMNIRRAEKESCGFMPGIDRYGRHLAGEVLPKW